MVVNVKWGTIEKIDSKMCQSGEGWETVHGLRDVRQRSGMLARRLNNLPENSSNSSELSSTVKMCSIAATSFSPRMHKVAIYESDSDIEAGKNINVSSVGVNNMRCW